MEDFHTYYNLLSKLTSSLSFNSVLRLLISDLYRLISFIRIEIISSAFRKCELLILISESFEVWKI